MVDRPSRCSPLLRGPRFAAASLGLGLALAIGLFATPAQAQEVSGFVELRAQAYLGVDGLPLTLVERVRPEFQAPLHDRIAIAAAVELGLSQGWNQLAALEELATDAGLHDSLAAAGLFQAEADNELLGVSQASDYLGVERLYLDFYLPVADVRVGRQAVNWGSALLVNPTDPFPEVLLTEPWRPRAGVNAARVTVPIGERHDGQLVVGSDYAFTRLRVAGRGRVNVLGTDIALSGAWRQEAEDGLVGLDIKGTLGVGFWFEGAMHLNEEPYPELAAGLDYSFPVLETLVVAAQYYRNGAGSQTGEPGAALELWTADADDPFGPTFTGRDYAMASLGLGLIPELSASALWIQNLGDGSALVVPTLTAMPTQRLDVSVAAQLPFSTWGDGGELHPHPDDLVVEVPDTSGGLAELDLAPLVPDATFILWTRFNF